MRCSRALVRAIVPLTLGGLVLTGCGGGSSKSSTPAGSSSAPGTPASSAAPAPTTDPLTGLKASDGGVSDHPVFIAKIDNTSSSRPQYGIGDADLVTQELVEGGITRLAAMFYSDLPAKAGPVRSARASDIGVVTPTHAVLVASGMAPPTVQRLNAAKVRYFTMGARMKL